MRRAKIKVIKMELESRLSIEDNFITEEVSGKRGPQLLTSLRRGDLGFN